MTYKYPFDTIKPAKHKPPQQKEASPRNNYYDRTDFDDCNDYTDYSYFRCLRDIFGPSNSRPVIVDELYNDMSVVIADFEDELDYRIQYALDELMEACDTYYEDKVLQGFIAGFKLSTKINNELECSIEE